MTNDLLIVVGAGASNEFGLPVGSELKTQITALLNFHTGSGFSVGNGDEVIYSAFRRNTLTATDTIQKLFEAAHHIHAALPQAISIDNFIDTHAGNANIELLGKLAIARSILKAEQNSRLYINERRDKASLDFSKLENTWLTKFFRLLTENCRQDGLTARMAAVTMIVFNYDRCIEHFLFHALRNYYRISEQEAAELIATMTIYHPYGVVGPLPWQANMHGVQFGDDPNPDQLLRLALGIKTFTEGMDPRGSQIEAIRTKVTEAEKALFLGFAFHPINVDLLAAPSRATHTNFSKKFFATGYGMSDSTIALKKARLARLGNPHPDNVHIRKDVTCVDLFHEYEGHISFV